ncbi:MAG: UvrD-helicase domain-containing protein [Trueperaceae bacterium]|nr:UvrD-helicase domain-containing protein [Trueperaceae bacterium]
MRVRVASAGTGKTTRLVARFLEAIQAGTPLRRIAGVTFTRAAAAELRERVGEGLDVLLEQGRYLDLVALDPDARPAVERARRERDGATLTTIHGFMALGLRLSAPRLGLDPAFGTLPPWEAQATFDEEFAGVLLLAEDPEHPLHGPATRLAGRAAERAGILFRQRSLAPTLTPADGDADAADLLALYRAAYARYQARIGAARLAPSEIERRALALVEVPEARARLAARAPHVIVDEYQDVNPVQGRFFAALEDAGVEVEVVGDPKQSIYGFRQADVEVFRAALAAGEALQPLTHTRRHAVLVTRFLNALTRSLAGRGEGFGPDEAPAVQAAGAQADVHGRVEIHWATGAPRLDDLRPHEAAVLADRLRAAHERDAIPWSDMAVLARNYAGLERVRTALAAHGVPAVLRQGRGYYERSEIRDLVHALRVGIDPTGPSLAPWLRGPFGGMTPDAIDAVVRAEDPVAALRDGHPHVAERVDATGDAVRAGPLGALRRLLREPFLDGERFVDRLDARQRDNVDALLFEVAERPPGELEVLLERLDLLSRRAKEAGDVPADGDGVTLITVHGSKGLEWPLVAVADVGAQGGGRPDPLHVVDGVVHLPGGPGFDAARAADLERARQEGSRLLYVAASRARTVLILTGSVPDRGPQGWAASLAAMRVGPDAAPRDEDGIVLAVHPLPEDGGGPPAAAPPSSTPPSSAPPSSADAEDVSREGGPAGAPLAEAPWTRAAFPEGELPPVESPSRVRGDADDEPPSPSAPRASGDVEPPAEPLAPGAAHEAGRLPGQAVAVGTLLHDAIRRDADPDDDAEMDLLRAQEVMFPYAPDEQARLLEEVRAMLRTYRGLLGGPLPPLEARTRDLREWPVVLPDGRQVWQGVIDRLYLVDGVWTLDDYKTDRTMRPGRYAFQLATYREAVRRALGVDPVARLVNLRDGATYPFDPADLDAAWAARPGGGQPTSTTSGSGVGSSRSDAL